MGLPRHEPRQGRLEASAPIVVIIFTPWKLYLQCLIIYDQKEHYKEHLCKEIFILPRQGRLEASAFPIIVIRFSS